MFCGMLSVAWCLRLENKSFPFSFVLHWKWCRISNFFFFKKKQQTKRWLKCQFGRPRWLQCSGIKCESVGMGQPRMVPGVPAAFAAARGAFTPVFSHQRILEVSSWRCWTRGLVGPCFLCRSFEVCACCSAPVFAWASSCVGTDATGGLWLFFCFYFFCKEELELDDSDASPPSPRTAFGNVSFLG